MSLERKIWQNQFVLKYRKNFIGKVGHKIYNADYNHHYYQ